MGRNVFVGCGVWLVGKLDGPAGEGLGGGRVEVVGGSRSRGVWVVDFTGGGQGGKVLVEGLV